MIQIRSTSDVIQENANLRNELEKMNQKFSKLKTELFDFKTSFIRKLIILIPSF